MAERTVGSRVDLSPACLLDRGSGPLHDERSVSAWTRGFLGGDRFRFFSGYGACERFGDIPTFGAGLSDVLESGLPECGGSCEDDPPGLPG